MAGGNVQDTVFQLGQVGAEGHGHRKLSDSSFQLGQSPAGKSLKSLTAVKFVRDKNTTDPDTAGPADSQDLIGSVAGAVQVKGEGTGLEAVPDVLVVLGVKLGVCF